MRKGIGILISLIALLSLGILVFLTIGRLGTRPRTDDAFLEADIVHMAPDVSGRIIRLDVSDNQYVHHGDVLFLIDPEPFVDRVAQAKASLRSLEAQLAVDVNQVASQISRAQAAAASTKSVEAQLALANVTVGRLAPLGARGYVTSEQVDQARTSARTAQVSLQASRDEARAAVQSVSSVAPLEAQIEAEQAELALAERNLRLTVVRAPCDGQITALSIAVGEYAATGTAVFTIIDTERWWAVGNFRETDLTGLRPGQAATVFVLSFGGQALRGVVDSLGGGVSPDEGSTSGGLPSIPRSLDWVRIAQRFPVRVLLQKPPPQLMRIGASVVLMIDR